VLAFDKQDYIEDLFKQPIRITRKYDNDYICSIFSAWKLITLYSREKKNQRVKCLMAINHHSVHLLFSYFGYFKTKY